MKPVRLLKILSSLLVLQLLLLPTTHASPAERLLVIHAVSRGNGVEQTAQAEVYDGILEFLTAHGYRMVDRQTAEQASMEIAATHAIDPLQNKAAAVGLKFLAEYTLYFRTTTLVKDPEKGIGALVRVTAQIVDNTTAQVLTSRTAELSSTGYTRDDAIDKAARGAGKKVAEQLTAVLDRYLTAATAAERTVIVVIEGNPLTVQRLQAALEKNRTVTSIREVESGGGKSTFEITCTVRRDQLDRDLLQIAGQNGWALIKIRSEGNRSTWKLR